MADNTQLNLGSGGDLISSDDIGGIKHQQVKIEFGLDGIATSVDTTSPLPVTLPNLELVQNTDSSSSKGVLSLAIVNDTPQSYIAGLLQALSLTPEGRLRVSSVTSDVTRVWNDINEDPFCNDDIYPTKNYYFND